jgi:ribonuclease HI
MTKRRKKKVVRVIHPSSGPLPARRSGEFPGKLLVFSDASLRKTGGLAAVLFPDPNGDAWIATRSVALTGSNELELQAALFALQQARQAFPERPLALFSDNQDTVLRLNRALDYGLSQDTELASLLAEWATSAPLANMVVCWIKGHASCRGNLLADRYAAETAESGLSQPMLQRVPSLAEPAAY